MVLVTVAWLAIIIVLLYLGNRAITRFLNKELPWSDYLTTRFFVQLLASLIYALICFHGSYFVFKILFTNDLPSPSQIFAVNLYSVLVILPAFSIYYVMYFMKEWKKSKVESEALQKESVKSQLLSLKNHLDPHFLFNNLNILSTLIEKGEENSTEYLNKFAEVYRYMLQNNTKELILLSDELEFIQSYLQLIKMRFRNALRFDVEIPTEKLELTIPPLTIQMLIENCVKHNALNESNPLNIDIKYIDDDYLLIQNNLTARKVKFQSNGSGLQNIKNRYSFFTDKPVSIENDGAHLKVLIPLIELEEI
jgi:sensor histidine kinase YesM